MNSRLCLLGLVLALLSWACSNDPIPTDGSGETFGLVTIVHSVRPEATEADPLRVRGLFVLQHELTREQALSVLRAPLVDLLDPKPIREMDQCTLRFHDLRYPELEEQDGAELILLEGGGARLVTDVAANELEMLSFPEILPFVSGIYYDAELEEITYEPSREYGFVTDGSQQLGALEAHVLAPPRVDSVRTATMPLTRETAADNVESLYVSWNEVDDPADVVQIEVLGTRYDQEVVLSCLCSDDGEFGIDPNLYGKFRTIVTEDHDWAVRLTVRRVNVTLFQVPQVQGRDIPSRIVGHLLFLVERSIEFE